MAEEVASSSQARKRWPAEAFFQNVLRSPALRGKISHHFLPYANDAFLVACFGVLLLSFNLTPVSWAECEDDGTTLLSSFKQLHLLLFLVRKHADLIKNAEVEDNAPEITIELKPVEAGAMAEAAHAKKNDDTPYEDLEVTMENDAADVDFIHDLLDWDE